MTTDPMEIFENLAREAQEFMVTDQHLTLLRHAYVRWEDIEFGAPAIDGKRPYGNSDVLGDIVEILFAEEARSRNPDMDEQDAYEAWQQRHEEELVRLHAETGIVLQIALSTGEFRAGRYRKRLRYGSDWERMGDAP